MCCLFGMIDYRGSFTGRQKTRLLSTLAAECEARGTDAAGVAYCAGGSLRVYKRPVPAHALRFRIPDHVPVVLGHTRMTTQGSQKKITITTPFSELREGGALLWPITVCCTTTICSGGR